MADAVYLGLDTSNYTTSAAVLTEDGVCLANIKRPLPVKDGCVGLRQSDAVFAHVKNLPSLMEEVASVLDGRSPLAVGVSCRPRNMEGSYMPCFLVGEGVAAGIGATSHCPVLRFSHQCGHVMAALFAAEREDLLNTTFCAFHVSGGTTDVLRVHASHDGGFDAERVGGACDLHAGQVIDRVGVYMGLPFPCGAPMEACALAYNGHIPSKKPSVKGLQANLSGLENMAKALYDETKDAGCVSAFVFRYIADTLCALSEAYVACCGATSFLFSGGVMSNSILKARLSGLGDVAFATPALSADNAVGIAALARRAHPRSCFNR